jgi:putative Mg2+ transporter-C (MgtC) family protein
VDALLGGRGKDKAVLGIDLLVRVGFALLLGLAIGVERQWRSRMAGMQTMALVSMGAALFVILGAYAFGGAGNPTQVAAQVVTGIGFIGAGVIMKQGLSVTGLNTAATLWATAAVGSLAGAWMWREAFSGAVAIVVANLVLFPLANRMDRLHFDAGRENPPTAYQFEVVCQATAVNAVRERLIDVLSASNFRMRSIGAFSATAPGEVKLRAELQCDSRDDSHLETAVQRITDEPAVRAAAWTIPDEKAAQWIGLVPD